MTFAVIEMARLTCCHGPNKMLQSLSAAAGRRKRCTHSSEVDVSVQTVGIQTAVPVFWQSSLSPLDFRCDLASPAPTLATLAFSR